MLVVVVAVVEEAEAVETERGGWTVGGTAEDEQERAGVADSAAVGTVRRFKLESGLTTHMILLTLGAHEQRGLQ